MLHAAKLAELMIAIAEHPNVSDLGLTKLWKLIYFIDARALRLRGETLTGSEFIKYEHGPVPSRGERILKKLTKSDEASATQQDHGAYRQIHIRAHRKANLAVFRPDETQIIEAVCQELGAKTATFLSELSHLEPAWSYAPMHEKLDPVLMHYGASEDPEGL